MRGQLTCAGRVLILFGFGSMMSRKPTSWDWREVIEAEFWWSLVVNAFVVSKG